MKRVIIISIVFFLASTLAASAQCAMCRATLENNISNGNIGIAAGINLESCIIFRALSLHYHLRVSLVSTSKRNAEKSIESNWAG